MKYLTLRNGWYIYNRRVPDYLKNFDPRQRVRIALKTKCEATAMRKMVAINDNVESYWKSLIDLKETHSNDKFKQLVKTAKQFGFNYVPAERLVDIPLRELLERIFTVQKGIKDPDFVQAILGTEERRGIVLSEALNKFWDYSKPLLLNKNKDQQRKWKNPRIKAVKNFIEQVDDKNVAEITNLDLIKFRDWWLERIKKENIKPNTVNKDFTHLRGVIETVSTHEQLDLDIDKVFKKIHIKEDVKRTRNAYSTAFIQEHILCPKALKDLDEEAKYILFVCANTGARPIEVVNLIKNNIHLDVPIPYINIEPRSGYSLKTRESERKIPLIGCALEALIAYPNGFKSFHGRSDRATSNINKWLTKKNLRPTKRHSVYSLRHSFQDRLNALELNDRIQCQLMGHKFNRPKYGDGASLEHLQKLMRKLDISR